MATNRIKGITIEIDGSTVGLQKSLSTVNSVISKTQSALKDVNNRLKFNPTSTEMLKQKQVYLNTAVEETKKKLEQEKEAMKQLQEAGKTTDNQEQQNALQREIEETTSRLKELEKQASGAQSVLGSQMQAVGDKIKATGDKVTEVGKKIKPVSGIAAGALALVGKTAIDFESAWTGVTKTVDGTPEQLEKIRQGILDLSQSTASSANDIAAVAEAAGQLGVKQENILNFTETMVRLGDSTDIVADEAATAIAQLYNIMGSDINTVDRFGATLVELGNNSATSESKIMNMATRVAAAGSQVGLTEQEILGLSATLASVGLQAEGGGSSISTVISAIDKAVALNSDTLTEWANVAGMSVNDFKNLWENDAMSAIQKIIAGMGDAKTGGENLNVILEDLGVKTIRQTDTMKRLSQASDLLTDSVEMSNSAWDENAALTNESDKRYQTTAAKITQLKNTLTELSVNLGDTLLPVVQSAVDKAKNLADKFTNMSSSGQKAVLVVAGIAAALSPTIMFTGKMIDSVGSIVKLSGKMVSGITNLLVKLGLKTAATAADTAASTANTAAQGASAVATTASGTAAKGASVGFGALNASMIIIVAAIAAVIVIVVLLVKNWDKIKEKAKELGSFVSGKWKELKTNVSNAVGNIKEKVSEKWNTLTTSVKTKTAEIKNNVSTKFNEIKNTMSTKMQSAKEAVKTKLDNIKNSYDDNGGGIKGIVSATMTGIKEYYQTGFDAINTITGGKLGNMVNTVTSKMKSVKSAISSKFTEIKNSAKTWGKDLIDNFVNGITNGIKKVGDAVGKIADKVKSLIGFSEPEDGPLSKFHTFAPDMIELFTKGIKNNMPMLNKTMNAMASSVQTALVNGINPNINIISPSEKASKTEVNRGNLTVNQTNYYSRTHSQRELYQSRKDLEKTISKQIKGAS